MKKFLTYFMLLLLAISLVACAGETVDTSALDDEIADLKAQLETAQKEIQGMGDGGGSGEMATTENTLAIVQERGTLKCAGNSSLVGFGFLDPETNEITGFDVDFCKAVAAALFGEGGAEKIEIIPTDGTTRFTVMQSGEADLLVRNTTWTFSRDVDLGFEFGPVTFYDGQGMMVRTESGIESLEDLDGGSVCVQAGTTTEKNLSDVMTAMGLKVESQVFPDNASTVAAYQNEQCDGFTTDKSGLVATQSTFDDPSAHLILDETMSKEPLGPLVRQGDNNWVDIMRWVVNCTIQGEESGVSMDNVESMAADSEDPTVINMLGAGDVDYGGMLGLSKDFCYQVISQVGNYGDIYGRHLGPDTPIALARGVNSLWTDGGLIYAPPFR